MQTLAVSSKRPFSRITDLTQPSGGDLVCSILIGFCGNGKTALSLNYRDPLYNAIALYNVGTRVPLYVQWLRMVL